MSGLLIRRGENGRLGFAHAAVRQYVTERLVPSHSEAHLHRILANHLARHEDDPVCQEDRLWHLFRDEQASAAPILNRVPADRVNRLASVVLDSLSIPGFTDSLRGLDANGIAFLTQTMLSRKSEVRTQKRIIFTTSVFAAARTFADHTDPDEDVLRAVSNAACGLADLPATVGVDLRNAAYEAFDYVGTLAARHPESGAAHEARALIAMWLARETMSTDGETALRASRIGAEEWLRVYADDASLRVKSWLQFALTERAGAELQAGNTAAARSLYEQALPLTREVGDAAHGSNQYNVNVINVLSGLGSVAGAEGDRDEELRHYGEALRLAESNYSEDPNRGATEQLAEMSRLYGVLLSSTSSYAEAHRWLFLSDELYHDLLQADAENARWPFGMDSAARAAAAEAAAARPGEAAKRIQRAIEAAPRAEPARSVIADSLTEAARHAAGAGNNTAAVAICEETVRLLTNDRIPTGDDHVRLADALSLRAHAQAQLGLTDAAAVSLRSSIASRRRHLDDSDAREYTTQARKIGTSLVELAFMYHGYEREPIAHQVAEHWTRYLADDAGVGGRANQWMAKHLATLAIASLDDAAVLLSAARRYAQHLVDSDPGNHNYLADLAGVGDVEGVAATEVGQFELAAQAWQHAAAIVGSVQSTNEQVAAARKSIAANLSRKLGDHCW